MGLTSHGVLILAAVMALLLLFGTVWYWPRFAAQTWRAVLGRIGALLATQLAVLCTLGLLANNYFAFYSSWDDLLGTGERGAVSVTGQQGEPGPGAIPSASPGATAAAVAEPPAQPVQRLGRADVDSGGRGREPSRVGEIEEIRIPGPSTGLSTDGYVYLPPQYFQAEYAERKFPAVIVLTGFPGDAKNLITRLNYPGTALQLMTGGRMQPTVLVLMRPSPALPADSECEDIPGGVRSETYFAKDVPRVLAASYRISTGPKAWGMVGNSTGGYCALKLTMRHPEVFPAGVSISGYYRAAEDVSTGDLFKGSQQRRNEADLMWRLKSLPGPPVAVMLAGSREGDGDYQRDTDAFEAAVRPPMTVATASVPTGGHNFQTWTRLLPPALEFLSQHLAP
ncbi:esterase family protein [Kitasatospora sp. Root107]|uniref:alpha/beta hydrolase n=1 Tax=Kitasatospora sp. Root107 TaxID=1736424 RepID=UPI00070CA9F4|nr:alpha/beta hydrolase-fold protein [Kitasatospora sp. Root107]KQV04621.1 esterase [Kitasatospora sp. Root107]